MPIDSFEGFGHTRKTNIKSLKLKETQKRQGLGRKKLQRNEQKLTKAENEPKRWRLEIRGVVQGVGFRPFVYSSAVKFDIKGFVGNESAGVFIEAQGEERKLDEFLEYLKKNLPPLAYISEMNLQILENLDETEFKIIESENHDCSFTLISPDISICADCLRELFDEKDRRYLYPFINCTNCGPRFTITKTIPYDRPQTTMAIFEMCNNCRAEYENPLDRRFHAQPISCWDCGVRAWFVGKKEKTNAFQNSKTNFLSAGSQTQEALKRGEIVAVKGIGGFHLACNAEDEKAVENLRLRKKRVNKPFAVMCRDLETARKYVELNQTEEAVLTSKERPIVLLKKRPENGLSELIAPNNRFLGVMLPYSPLHYLLFSNDLTILVMTSGNLSGEPIVKDNEEALEKLNDLADAFLLHNREIYVHCDDSVVGVYSAEIPPKTISLKKPTDIILPFRRSRGYAPFPVELPFAVPQILAVGGELKATFCLTKEKFAFMSQHLGDMENLETLEAFEKASEQMQRLFRVKPEIIVGDLHPNYLSSNWANKKYENFVRVQHHQAHLAAVMAENRLSNEKIIGFAFDGTGYGTDGNIWGGEVFQGDYQKFERIAHLRYFPLAGGDISVKNVYRLALSLLREAEIEWKEDLACVVECSETERNVLQKQLEKNLNVIQTSSFGRLFDAVASIVGVRQRTTYEAQAAIEFEGILDENVTESYEFELIEDEKVLIDYRNLVVEIVRDVRAGVVVSKISAKFHNAVANLILRLSWRFEKDFGLRKIALSGGCFQNIELLKKTAKRLENDGFEVLTHKLVPPNDGGLALGQALIAAQRH